MNIRTNLCDTLPSSRYYYVVGNELYEYVPGVENIYSVMKGTFEDKISHVPHEFVPLRSISYISKSDTKVDIALMYMFYMSEAGCKVFVNDSNIVVGTSLANPLVVYTIKSNRMIYIMYSSTAWTVEYNCTDFSTCRSFYFKGNMPYIRNIAPKGYTYIGPMPSDYRTLLRWYHQQTMFARHDNMLSDMVVACLFFAANMKIDSSASSSKKMLTVLEGEFVFLIETCIGLSDVNYHVFLNTHANTNYAKKFLAEYGDICRIRYDATIQTSILEINHSCPNEAIKIFLGRLSKKYNSVFIDIAYLISSLGCFNKTLVGMCYKTHPVYTRDVYIQDYDVCDSMIYMAHDTNVWVIPKEITATMLRGIFKLRHIVLRQATGLNICSGAQQLYDVDILFFDVLKLISSLYHKKETMLTKLESRVLGDMHEMLSNIHYLLRGTAHYEKICEDEDLKDFNDEYGDICYLTSVNKYNSYNMRHTTSTALEAQHKFLERLSKKYKDPFIDLALHFSNNKDIQGAQDTIWALILMYKRHTNMVTKYKCDYMMQNTARRCNVTIKFGKMSYPLFEEITEKMLIDVFKYRGIKLSCIRGMKYTEQLCDVNILFFDALKLISEFHHKKETMLRINDVR